MEAIAINYGRAPKEWESVSTDGQSKSYEGITKPLIVLSCRMLMRGDRRGTLH